MKNGIDTETSMTQQKMTMRQQTMGDSETSEVSECDGAFTSDAKPVGLQDTHDGRLAKTKNNFEDEQWQQQQQ